MKTVSFLLFSSLLFTCIYSQDSDLDSLFFSDKNEEIILSPPNPKPIQFNSPIKPKICKMTICNYKNNIPNWLPNTPKVCTINYYQLPMKNQIECLKYCTQKCVSYKYSHS